MHYSIINFYLSYLYFKLRIPIDVKKGWITIFIAEILWIINNAFQTKFNVPKTFQVDYVETINGKFYLTPDIISYVTVSPAFERLDSDYLTDLIKIESKNNKVLFIDVGAYFGDYTIKVANKFKNTKEIDIIALEPGTEYLSKSTKDQLTANVKLNNCKNVKIVRTGLGSKSEINKLKIKVVPLDKILPTSAYNKYDVVFIKLDIDDYVLDGLKGLSNAVDKFNNVYLLVEDFVKPKQVVKYLKDHNYKFIIKRTPYNSFWNKKND